MEELYIVTGAGGHLGGTIVRMLLNRSKEVRGLILPEENGVDAERLTYIRGDVRNIESLRPLFEGCEGKRVIVIHTAGIIDISDQVTKNMFEVNVLGTRNVADLCMVYHVSRLIYVSSVHAIPEKKHLQVHKEVSFFSPTLVTGGYAKTKAAATQLVLKRAARGLDVVVVHPSGILGPNDPSGNHLVQLVKDYVNGKLPACVKGGYDFVDVRDVALGCLAAAEKGRRGECSILSNRHYEIRDVLKMIRSIHGGRRLPTLPVWLAKAVLPMLKCYSRMKKRRPLYTHYSLYTLTSNDRFSHDKATRELDYRPRDLYETLADTIDQMPHAS